MCCTRFESVKSRCWLLPFCYTVQYYIFLMHMVFQTHILYSVSKECQTSGSSCEVELCVLSFGVRLVMAGWWSLVQFRQCATFIQVT